MGISGYHDVQDIGSRRGVVWVSGWGVRTKNETGIPVGIVTQEFPPPRAQPRVAVDMFGVQVAGHEDRQPAAKASVQVRSNQWAQGERYAARTFTGLPASIICMAVASSWVRPGTGTGW